MFLFVKFVHVIMAMVFFGLPFAFGRWFHSASIGDDLQVVRDAIARMRLFVRVHLNLCGMLLLGTGVYLSPPTPLWAILSLVLLALALVNLNLHLGNALARYQCLLDLDRPTAAEVKRMRIHIAVFSAVHHTLVTAATAMMIFRWPN